MGNNGNESRSKYENIPILAISFKIFILSRGSLTCNIVQWLVLFLYYSPKPQKEVYSASLVTSY